MRAKYLIVFFTIASVLFGLGEVRAKNDSQHGFLHFDPSNGAAANVTVARVIQPSAVLSTSEWGQAVSDGRLGNLIDGSGLSGAGPVKEQTHDNNSNAATMWHAGDVDGGLGGPVGSPPEVSPQAVVFNLGAAYVLKGAYIWNMNQAGLTQRGVDELDIQVSSGDDPLTALFSPVGSFNLAQASGGGAEPAQLLSFTASEVRLVRFDIKTAHSDAIDDFVGLSEVRFLAELPDIIFVDKFEAPEIPERGPDDIVNGANIGDAGNSIETAHVTSLDGFGDRNVTGSVGYADDAADYYQVTPSLPGTMALDLTGLGDNLDLRLFDSEGNVVASSTSGGAAAESIAFEVLAGETLNIAISPDVGARSNYELVIDAPGFDEF